MFDSVDSVVMLLDGCESPPYVENATATFSQFSRSVSLTCIKGHRFPTGQRSLTAHCNQDGSWQLIDHCQGIRVCIIDSQTWAHS